MIENEITRLEEQIGKPEAAHAAFCGERGTAMPMSIRSAPSPERLPGVLLRHMKFAEGAVAAEIHMRAVAPLQ